MAPNTRSTKRPYSRNLGHKDHNIIQKINSIVLCLNHRDANEKVPQIARTHNRHVRTCLWSPEEYRLGRRVTLYEGAANWESLVDNEAIWRPYRLECCI